MADEVEGEWGGEFDPFADPEEKRVLFAALDSFRQFRRAAHYNTTHVRRQSFYALPSAHWTLLAEPPFSYLDTLDRVDAAIDSNADLAEAILAAGLASFGLSPDSNPANPPSPADDWRGTSTAGDLEKARITLRQFYRDWSAEGAAERTACYDPVLTALQHEFASVTDKVGIKVLIPGAGLGRLVFEVCAAGFAAEGNEISYHALLASAFVLNHAARAGQFELFPWAMSFSNHVTREHQLASVPVPDLHPGTALDEASRGMETPAFGRMDMCAADFVVSYAGEEHRASYDAVATVFFLDTAPNVIRYIEAVRNCLKMGGVWINLGPLLWHFEDTASGKRGKGGGDEAAQHENDKGQLGIGEAGSVELTDQEVVLLLEKFGFKVEKHEGKATDAGYIQNPESMLQNIYRTSYWVARKIS